jgi:hypothetical protein
LLATNEMLAPPGEGAAVPLIAPRVSQKGTDALLTTKAVEAVAVSVTLTLPPGVEGFWYEIATEVAEGVNGDTGSRV